jgi:hypothetical protein
MRWSAPPPFNTPTNPAILEPSTNPGGRYGRREIRSGTDDGRDEQRRRRDEESCQERRQKGQEGSQESREKGDAEEESKKSEKSFEEILGEEISQKGRQESRQKEKEGQEIEALSAYARMEKPSAHRRRLLFWGFGLAALTRGG